jgi:CBS domain-containing protein
MKVRDVMHKGVQWVSPDTPVVNVAKKMREHDIGAVPVGENDRLVGMVTDRDITIRAVAEDKNISELTARDVMTSAIIYCRDTEEVADAVRIMESKQIRRLPVIDENKRMVGIVALGDISHSGSRDLAAEVMKAVSEHHR